MGMTMFLILLSGFSVLSSLVTEGVKKIINDKVNNLIATITSLVIGCGGTFVYYVLSGIAINYIYVIYAILMGFATGLVAMVGYDKVKQAISQFTNIE